MSTICMKLDPGMHIGLHLVSFGKTGVTPRLPIGVGVNELIRQVLLSGVFSHLVPAPPTTRGLLALGCGFTRKISGRGSSAS
jgi:hypothetical protein